MQPGRSTEAIVLRRTDYGEADRIVTMLTPELGRIGVLAKGVRKPSSKLAGGIEPFALLKVTVRKGRGELWTLTSAGMQTSWSHIIEDYDRLQLAYAILKKVNQTAETMDDSVLHDLLKISLSSLDRAAVDVRITEAWFWAQLLQVLGHGLNISRDVNGEKLSAEGTYRFSMDDMAFVPDEKAEFGESHLKVLKLLHLRPPETIARIGGVENVIGSCLALLRNINS